MFKNLKNPAKNSSVPAQEEEIVRINPQKDSPFINGDRTDTARSLPSELPLEPVDNGPRKPMKKLH